MAIAMLAEIRGLTQTEYENVVRKVNEAGPPAGALLHAGGPVEGGYRVIEVWQTRDLADAFYNSPRYRDAVAAISAQPEIVMTWPVYGIDQGQGWHQTT